MDDNPYQSPKADLTKPKPNPKAPSHTREELRRIAVYQKGVETCLAAYVVLLAGQVLAPPDYQVFPGVGAIVVAIAGTVVGCLLAIRTCGTGVGIVFGLLSLVPCFGLIMLFHLSNDARVILKENGIKVGLFGARLSDI